jgi:2,5-furandicarboxylate decarboxylase 1
MTAPAEPDQDLHEFLSSYAAEHPDDVLDVDTRLDADQDITAIVWELARRGESPLVVCSNVEGIDSPVVTNMFASRERIASALGTTTEGLHAAFHGRAASPRPLKIIDSGPVTTDVVSRDDVDLTDLPMVGHFAGDRGPYLTSAIVIAEDPDDGTGNASYHRAMLHSRNQLATSLHSKGHLWRYLRRAADRGQKLPVAMVIGGHPLFMLACAARVGIDVDERMIAGGLFGAGLEVVPTPRYGIGVPASAEFVLEGHLDPEASAPEGPFGEFSGYSSGRSTNDVLTVETVMRRTDAILLDVVGGHSADHLTLSRLPRESEMVARIKERFPEVRSLVYPSSGTHFHCYVSLTQPVPGYARQVILAMLGWDPYLKLVVTVDADIDVFDEPEVLWAIATRFQASRDLIVVDELPGHLLDPSSAADGRTARMGIDATKAAGFEAQPLVIDDASTERAKRVLEARRVRPSAL